MSRFRGSSKSQPIQYSYHAQAPSSGLHRASPGVSIHPAGYFVDNAPHWTYQQPPTGWQGSQYPYSHTYAYIAPNAVPAYYQPPQGPHFNPPSQHPVPSYPQNHVPTHLNHSQPHVNQSQTNSSRPPPAPAISQSRSRSSDRGNNASHKEEDFEVYRRRERSRTPGPASRVSGLSHGAHVAALSGSRPPTARSELVPVLVATITSFPSVDWNITYPPSMSHMLIENGERFPLDMDHKAIVPAVDGLYIKPSKLSPLSLVVERWGPIIVSKSSKKSKKSNGVTVGDVLQSIYAYFNTCITTDEIQKLQAESEKQTKLTVINSRSKRWKDLLQNSEIADKDKDYLMDDIGRDPTRADFLHGYLHYAGLKMPDDFHETRTLLLTLENPAHVRRLAGKLEKET